MCETGVGGCRYRRREDETAVAIDPIAGRSPDTLDQDNATELAVVVPTVTPVGAGNVPPPLV
jgi:hypothetical protein